MDDLLARTMVENLSIGIDPITGKLLRQDDSCANEFVQEAIRTVLDHCTIDSYATILERQQKEKKEQKEKSKEERKVRYPNQGKPWTKSEEGTLSVLCREGYYIPHIANILKRSPSAIADKMKKLGLTSTISSQRNLRGPASQNKSV